MIKSFKNGIINKKHQQEQSNRKSSLYLLSWLSLGRNVQTTNIRKAELYRGSMGKHIVPLLLLLFNGAKPTDVLYPQFEEIMLQRTCLFSLIAIT